MTVLYLIPCKNKVCYEGTELYWLFPGKLAQEKCIKIAEHSGMTEKLLNIARGGVFVEVDFGNYWNNLVKYNDETNTSSLFGFMVLNVCPLEESTNSLSIKA